jgi:two-component system, sensor histidine kinase LadS
MNNTKKNQRVDFEEAAQQVQANLAYLMDALKVAQERAENAEQRATHAEQRADAAEKKAATDALTGIFNKGHFMDSLDRRAVTSNTLLMIDLDGFKPINDNFGHIAGDRALQAVANMLRKHTRKSDIVARVGGDEFAVLLCGAQEGTAERKAEKIRNELSGNLKFQWEDAVITVRGSVGFYVAEPHQSAEEVYKGGDAVMYQIKQAKGDTRHNLAVVSSAAPRLAR